jgi:hypothetical protein
MNGGLVQVLAKNTGEGNAEGKNGTDRTPSARFALPYVSVPLGPGIHLRCYPMPEDGQRWEFVHVSKQGKATHHDLPDLGSCDVIHHGDKDTAPLDQLAPAHGRELKAVLLLVLAVARDPGFYGVSTEDWQLAASEPENGWRMIMEKISRLHGRAIGRVKVVMSSEDWNSVYQILDINAPLRQVLLGLAVPPPRGETLLMWLPADLVAQLHDEANRRNLKPSKIVLEALRERYEKK